MALRRALDPSMVRMSRIAIAQADRFPELAERLRNASGTSPRQRQVAELLRQHAARGTVVLNDQPEVLADLFIGMVSSAPARLASFGIVADQAEAEGAPKPPSASPAIPTALTSSDGAALGRPRQTPATAGRGLCGSGSRRGRSARGRPRAPGWRRRGSGPAA